MTTLNAEFATSSRANRKGQKRYGGKRESRAQRMRERKRHQREPDAHHFRSAAARAQIVERQAEHQQKDGEEHVGRPGDDGAQQRRMQRQQQRGDAGRDVRQAAPCETTRNKGGEQREQRRPRPAPAPACRPARARRRASWRETARSDRPRRSGRSAPGRRRPCWRRPTAATRRRRPGHWRTAMAASARIATKAKRRRSARAAQCARARARAGHDASHGAPPGAPTSLRRACAATSRAAVFSQKNGSRMSCQSAR